MNDAVILIDKHSFSIVYANRPVLEKTGFTLEDLRGMNLIYFSSNTNSFTAANLQIKLNEAVLRGFDQFEWQIKVKGNELIWVDIGVHLKTFDGIEYIVVTIKNISDYKEKEKLMLKNNEQFNSVFNNSAIGLYQSTIDGKFIMFNSALINILGYHRKPELLRTIDVEKSCYLNPEHRYKFKRILLENGSIYNFETSYRKLNGDIIHVKESARLNKRSDGKIVIEGLLEDITIRKESEIALKDSEQRFKEISHSVADWIWEIDSNDVFTFVSGKVEMLLGYKVDEIIGKTPFDFMPLHEAGRMKELFKHLKNFRLPIANLENWKIRKDGKEVCFATNGVPIINKEGEYQGYRGVDIDITERKRARDLVTKSESKYKVLFEMAPEAIILLDKLGNVADVNKKFTEYTGKSREEIIGINASDLDIFEENERNLVVSNFKRTIEGEIVPPIEMKFKNARNEISTGLINRQVIRDSENNVTGVMVIISDISTTKEFESELISAKSKAERSERLKTEFLAQMSHEIRTPLNTIFNFTTLIQEELKTDSSFTKELEDCFSSINSAGTRIIRTVDLILNMSELQNNTYESNFNDFNLSERIIENLFTEYAKRAESKGITITLSKETEDLILHADEYTIEHILLNILDNALKYTKHGEIKIRVFKNSMSELSVSISDTGIGIAEEYLSTIFEPFTQEEQGYTRQYDGTGLGLALVKKYCAINNATIQVVSTKGVGTTFTVTFKHKSTTNKNIY